MTQDNHFNSESAQSQQETLTDSMTELVSQVVDTQDSGIIVVAAKAKVCLWNSWVVKHSGLTSAQALNQSLTALFHSLENTPLLNAVDDAICRGMSRILSQIFNPHPLPLYIDCVQTHSRQLMHQQIIIKPLTIGGENYALIEIKDVSASVRKEAILKQQNMAMKKLVDENKSQQQHLENILDSSTDAILTLTQEGIILDCNQAASHIFKASEQNIRGESIAQFLPGFEVDNVNVSSKIIAAAGRDALGEALSLEASVSQLKENEKLIVMTLRDVTYREQMEAALFRQDRLAKVALESIADGVITTNKEGVIELYNPIAATLLGLDGAQLQGVTITQVFQLQDEVTGQLHENIVLKAIQQSATVHSSDHSSLKTSHACDGLPIMATASPIFDSQHCVSGSVLVFRDVQESRRISTRLSWEASHDTLTGLANRRAFNQRLEKVVQESTPTILLFLDLDRFKLVNDTAGHAIGDELLKRISEIFQEYFRDGDFIARLGGDEFAVILEHCPLEKARELAQELCTRIEQFPFPWQDRIFTVGVSIGLSQVYQSDNSPSNVIERADAACYSAKQTGRSRVHVYGESNQETEYQEKINRASDISEAIAHERFVLYKQPIVTISKNQRQLHHYEILIRMLDDDNKIIPPNDFIPAAEQFGLMQSVDRFVITKVVRFILGSRQDDQPASFAVNLSGASIIDERFLHFLDDLLEREGITADNIHFEITETAAIANLAKARVFLEHFKNKGFSFALDDFGSGMSSFGYLKNLPIDYIKIDGQFVREIVGNETDFAMVSSINYLGHMMGLKCIAEFVENDEIYAVLDSIGVDFAQGYGIEKPTPLFEYSKAS